MTGPIWLLKNNSLSSILQLIHKTPEGYSKQFCYFEVNLPIFFSLELLGHSPFNKVEAFIYSKNIYRAQYMWQVFFSFTHWTHKQHQV